MTDFLKAHWDVDDGDLSIYAFDDDGGIVPLFQVHADCDDEIVSFAEIVKIGDLVKTAPDLLAALLWLHRGEGAPVDVAAVIARATGA